MPKRRRSRHEWKRLLAQLEQSGQSPDEFAAARQINVRTLKWWRTRLKSKALTLVPLPTPVQPDVLPLNVQLDGRVAMLIPVESATPAVAVFLARVANELRA